MCTFWRVSLTLTLILICATNLFGQTLTIDDFGHEAILYLDSSEIAVRFVTDAPSAVEDFAINYPEVDQGAEGYRLFANVYGFQLHAESDLDGFLTRLSADSNVSEIYRGARSPAGERLYVSGTFLVQVAPDADIADIIVRFDEYGLRLLPERTSGTEVLVFQISRGDSWNIAPVLASASTIPGVLCVVPGILFKLTILSTPNDYFWSGQQQYFQQEYLDLERAYDMALSDSTVTIYFLDDGVADHEDWPQPFDIIGFDYLWYDSAFHLNPTYSHHGMGVLGVAYAAINNEIGIAGFNNDHFSVRLHQVFHMTAAGKEQWTTSWFMYWAIRDAVDAGADIISLSWIKDTTSFTGYGTIESAIDYAHANGVLVIAGAGNCNDYCSHVQWPACYDKTFAVGGARPGCEWHFEASYGPELDAVGYYSVITLDQMGENGISRSARDAPYCDNESNPNYYCGSGTSYCAPQAAGIAGLVLARRPDLKNQPDLLAEILRYSAENGEPPCVVDTSFDLQLGYGCLNAFRALLAVSRGDMNNDASIDISDVAYVIDYLFHDGLEPSPHLMVGDATCDCSLDISDLTFLVSYIYGDGPAPGLCYKYWD